MNSTLSHPDASTLAAYLDRRLPEAERLRVVEHLAVCEDCWERTSDTVDVLEELEAVEDDEANRPASVDAPAADVPGEDGADRVLTFPGPDAPPTPKARRKIPAGRWAGVAAALVVAALGSMFWSGPSLEVDRLVAALPTSSADLREHLADEVWSNERSAAAPTLSKTDAEQQQAALRLGARATRLQAALAIGDRDTAQLQLGLMAAHAGELGSVLPLVSEYGRLAEALAQGEDPRDLSRLAAARDQLASGNLESSPYALGKWVEAGRLAALSGDPEALREPVFRDIPRALRRADLPDRYSLSLKELERVLSRRDADPDAVAEAFAAVLAAQ